MLLIILAIFALALVFLGYLYKKTEKLGQTVFIGLLLGLGAGALLQSLAEQDLITSVLDWINLVGSGYVRLSIDKIAKINLPVRFFEVGPGASSQAARPALPRRQA